MSFQTTHWSLVVAAGSGDSSRSRAALAKLCETYWYPLYAYVRRRGANPDDARDLTQGFLASLLERRDLENLRQERGRFRSFLLASLQHFLLNDAASRHAQKRGGGVVVLPLEFENAEGRYSIEPADRFTPESLFERRWALLVIERVLSQLRREWESEGRALEFDNLKACLLGETPEGGYGAIAEKLSSSDGAVRVAVHRLRKKFRTRLKQEISDTVASPGDVDDEIRHLILALNA